MFSLFMLDLYYALFIFSLFMLEYLVCSSSKDKFKLCITSKWWILEWWALGDLLPQKRIFWFAAL